MSLALFFATNLRQSRAFKMQFIFSGWGIRPHIPSRDFAPAPYEGAFRRPPSTPGLFQIFSSAVKIITVNSLHIKYCFMERGISTEQGSKSLLFQWKPCYCIYLLIGFCTIEDVVRPLWLRIQDQARESYAMREVFSMDSTMRVQAIENLGRMKSSSVDLHKFYIFMPPP